jgi:hypothetical protein
MPFHLSRISPMSLLCTTLPHVHEYAHVSVRHHTNPHPQVKDTTSSSPPTPAPPPTGSASAQAAPATAPTQTPPTSAAYSATQALLPANLIPQLPRPCQQAATTNPQPPTSKPLSQRTSPPNSKSASPIQPAQEISSNGSSTAAPC